MRPRIRSAGAGWINWMHTGSALLIALLGSWELHWWPAGRPCAQRLDGRRRDGRPGAAARLINRPAATHWPLEPFGASICCARAGCWPSRW
jgi:hypothetical protein